MNNNIVNLRRVSFAPTEASVTGPYRPQDVNTAPRDGWRNSDTIYPRTPAHIDRIRQLPAANQSMRQAQPLPPVPQPAAPQPMSLGRRIIGLIGVACASVGTVAGLVSIVALGPIGLAVAGGAFVLGLVLIRASSKD